MSQFDWGVMDPNSKSGPQLALDLNDFRDALNTLHRGASRPPYAQPGMQWMKEVSSERWDLVVYDGSVDLVLRSFNPTTSEVLKLPTTAIDGLDDSLSKAVQKDSSSTTGAALLPAGTSAQRPGTPQAGMIRYNASLTEYERYQGGKWLALNALDKAINEAPMVTLASASSMAIGAAAANTITVSGSVTINAFDTISAGVTRRLVFQGAPTLTHNATSLVLPGAANITTEAGDVAEFLSLGAGNWRCVGYTRRTGTALVDVGIGVGQDYVSVLASRALETTYTNTTGRTITVHAGIRGSNVNGVRAEVLINGSAYLSGAVSGTGYGPNFEFPVPPGKTYRINVTLGTPTLSTWSEIR